MGLVISSEQVNPDSVSISLWTAAIDPFYPLGVCFRYSVLLSITKIPHSWSTVNESIE